MATIEVTVSFRPLARELHIPEWQIQAVVDLLDAGNTVPFITRYRKDQTGGLDEETIRTIYNSVKKLRQLAERKQTILRAIEAQNKLTPTLAKKILAATSLRRLDDLYLPYRPKKQTLATIARERGLGHLAEEILNADPICADLDKRAADYIDPDKKVLSIADALLGAGHILAEMFSENTELRTRLRELIMKTGVIRATRILPESPPARASAEAEPAPVTADTAAPGASPIPSGNAGVVPTGAPPVPEAPPSPAPEKTPAEAPGESSALTAEYSGPVTPTAEQAPATAPQGTVGEASPEAPVTPDDSSEVIATSPAAAAPAMPTDTSGPPAGSEALSSAAQESSAAEALMSRDEGAVASTVSPDEAAKKGDDRSASAEGSTTQEGSVPSVSSPTVQVDPRKAAKEAEKRRKQEKLAKEFADYFDFSQTLRSIPPHRILALNRGEALKILRVKIEADMAALEKALDEICIPKDHPHADFLRGCARDALTRLILPSLEREIRRELTERAERHAVKVFAHNLRRLLLQRPVRDRRVLAIDPGYRQGCKLAALDECGNVLDHGLIYLVEKRGYTRDMAKKTVVEMIEKHGLTAIAIGNGTGCRLAEMFVADLLENELKGRGIGYTIVNEAGASVYSTSQIGREELPHLDATYRGAVSIGRRLLDPLSELVKIEPANLGVGLYQHDLKEKHLRESLDEVVESCVNYVGVDVNTASPALLGYVSGLNKLTARRIVEYRQQHGPFKTREELKKVPGVGEATFVQAAGFLKITGGDNPLDATWIHPESYDLAHRVLEKLGFSAEDLTKAERKSELAERIAQVDAESLAAELGCGVLLLKDILAQFVRPGRDPRDDLPPPVFKQGILKLEDLSPGMELMGTVMNVVDFGAFVDVGLPNTGLIHRSRMKPNTRSADPHSVVAVGDVVRVWVVDVDRERRRISLSLVPLQDMAETKTGNGKATRRGEDRASREKDKGKGRKPLSGRPSGEEKASGEQAAQPAGAGAPRRSRQESPPRERSAEPGSRPAPLPISRPVELPRRRAQPEPPPPAEPLSEEVLAGKQPMRSFADLFQYFAAKGVVRPTAAAQTGGRDRRRGKKEREASSAERRPKDTKSPAASAGSQPTTGDVPGNVLPPEDRSIGTSESERPSGEANARATQSAASGAELPVETPPGGEAAAPAPPTPSPENTSDVRKERAEETPPTEIT